MPAAVKRNVTSRRFPAADLADETGQKLRLTFRRTAHA
jgi:hypothetical protein